MSQSHFVPENWTDFIFTVFGEELGLVGCVGLLALFGIMLLRMLRAALRTRELFGTLLCVGVAAMFAFQLFENIGMTVGLMPVAGIPLPLVSYGGSAMLTNWMAIGLVSSVAARAR
jgi:rod shape determining protein RodA